MVQVSYTLNVIYRDFRLLTQYSVKLRPQLPWSLNPSLRTLLFFSRSCFFTLIIIIIPSSVFLPTDVDGCITVNQSKQKCKEKTRCAPAVRFDCNLRTSRSKSSRRLIDYFLTLLVVIRRNA